MVESTSSRAPSNTMININELPTYDLEYEAQKKDGNVAKGGVSCPFPWRLHVCLEAVEEEGLSHIISWSPHGRSFTVHQPKLFVELVMPRFFGQTRFASFQRQLNIYGYNRFLAGKDKGAYYHLHFVRSNRPLVRGMVRRKIKGIQHSKTHLSAREQIQEQRDLDFYHPAWIDHKEPCIPPSLAKKQPNKQSQSVTRVGSPAQRSFSSAPRRNSDASAASSLGPPPPVFSDAEEFAIEEQTLFDSPSTGFGRDLVVTDSLARMPSVSTTTTTATEESDVSTQDDEQMYQDFSFSSDAVIDAPLNAHESSGDMALFEGNVFHVLDGPKEESFNDSSLLAAVAPTFYHYIMQINYNASMSTDNTASPLFPPPHY